MRVSAWLDGSFLQRKLIRLGNIFLLMEYIRQWEQPVICILLPIKRTMQAIESSLYDQFAVLDKIVYKALAPVASSSLDDEFDLRPEKMGRHCEQRQPEEVEEDDLLKQYSHIVLDNRLYRLLNQIWSCEYVGNPKEALFARNYHMQRRCVKAVEKEKRKPEENGIKYEEKFFEVSLGEQLTLFFTSDDLKSIKKGPIPYCIIQNYVKILQAARVVTESHYVFPEQFLQQLMGGDPFDHSESGQQTLKAIIRKNFTTYHSQINVNLLDPDYLIIPIFLGESQKCMIVQRVSRAAKLGPRFNIILCNLTEEKGKIYVLALRTILEMAMGQGNITNNTFFTIPVLIPREPSPADSSLYLLLSLQFLFSKKCAELLDLRCVKKRNKMHLFPRCLSLNSREQIYDLFIRLAEEQSLSSRVLLCQNFISRRAIICNNAPLRPNYDEIDQREVQKFRILYRQGVERDEGKQFQDVMEYYLDEDINYERSFFS